MAGDDFKPVRPGEPFRFPAPVYNRMLDVVRQGGSGAEPGGAGATWRRDAHIVKVQNKTGAAIEQFAIVALRGPVLTPEDAPDTFKWNLCIEAHTPQDANEADFGRWAVMLEPLDVDKIGRAVAAGVTLCKITVEADESDAYDVHRRVDCDGAALVPNAAGAGVVLWDDGEDGERWALVRIGTAFRAGGAGVTTSSITVRSGTTPGSGTVQPKRRSASNVLESFGNPITVYNLSTTETASGKYVQYKIDEHGDAWLDFEDCE